MLRAANTGSTARVVAATDEILLYGIGDPGAGRGGIPGRAIGAAARRDQRQARSLHPLDDLRRERNAAIAPGGIVDDDGFAAGALGVVEYQGGTELADRGGAVALFMGEPEHADFVQIVAAEMRIDVAQDRIVFNEWRHRAAGARHRPPRVDRVAEVAGVAEIVAGRHGRGIGGGEGGKQRVAVDERNALTRQRRNVGRCGVVDGARAQPVGDEDHDVMRSALRSSGLRRRTGCDQNAGHQISQPHGRPR